MKKLITIIAALCIALPAAAADKKNDKDKGKDRYKKPEKEVPAQMWSVVVEGGSGETAVEEVKAFLNLMRGVKVESCETRDKTVEAVISSKERVTRSDVAKALKEKKEFKVKDFKTKRPDKNADKKEEGKKEGDKKPTDKPGDKPGDKKTEDPKKAEGTTKEDPKKEKEMKEDAKKAPAAPAEKKES